RRSVLLRRWKKRQSAGRAPTQAKLRGQAEEVRASVSKALTNPLRNVDASSIAPRSACRCHEHGLLARRERRNGDRKRVPGRVGVRQAAPRACAISSALYRSARKTWLLSEAGGPPKNGLPKNGLMYSQTISPPLVTSKNRPKEESVINVLPFGRR